MEKFNLMSTLTNPDQGHRIDHQGYTPEIWIGLFITALYLLQTHPAIVTISDSLEFALDGLLALGAGISTLAAFLGTRWFFPRFPKRASYKMQLVGLPIIILTLAWYTYASASSPNLVLVALGGGLGLCIEIGSVRMIVDIADDLRGDP